MERVPCGDCGELILAGAKVCRFCGRGRPAATSPKSPTLAALLSLLLPGAGQLYTGREWGFAFFLLVALLAVVFFPAALALWFWSVFDAAARARKLNRR